MLVAAALHLCQQGQHRLTTVRRGQAGNVVAVDIALFHPQQVRTSHISLNNLPRRGDQKISHWRRQIKLDHAKHRLFEGQALLVHVFMLQVKLDLVHLQLMQQLDGITGGCRVTGQLVQERERCWPQCPALTDGGIALADFGFCTLAQLRIGA